MPLGIGIARSNVPYRSSLTSIRNVLGDLFDSESSGGPLISIEVILGEETSNFGDTSDFKTISDFVALGYGCCLCPRTTKLRPTIRRVISFDFIPGISNMAVMFEEDGSSMTSMLNKTLCQAK